MVGSGLDRSAPLNFDHRAVRIKRQLSLMYYYLLIYVKILILNVL